MNGTLSPMNGTLPSVRRRLLVSLVWSLAFAVAFLALYVLAVVTPWGQAVDERSFGQPYWAHGIFNVLRLACPVLAGVAAAFVVVAALVRRHWLDVAACLLGAAIVIVVTGPLRDDVLVRPWFGVASSVGNSFPSRHVVVTCALALIVVRLWGWARGRNTVLVFAVALTSLDALASVASFAHRASDTMGAVLLVGIVVPLYARGHVPAFSALRRSTASWRTILAGVGIWLVALALAVFAGAEAATVGFVVLIVLGTAGLSIPLVQVLGRSGANDALSTPLAT